MTLYRSIPCPMTAKQIRSDFGSMFNSTTPNFETTMTWLAANTRNTLMILNVSPCFMGAVDISRVSYFPEEKEVLFLAGCSIEYIEGPKEHTFEGNKVTDIFEVFVRSRPQKVMASTGIT